VLFGGSRILVAQPNPKHVRRVLFPMRRKTRSRGLPDDAKRGEAEASFVLCVRNGGYPAGLELRKVYRVLADEQASKVHQLRVIDESGEDYLYPEGYFVSTRLCRAETG
jgi:hypothetical protein